MAIQPASTCLYNDVLPYVVDLAPSDKGTWFRRLEHRSILEAEARLGYTFPREVRAFYEEIGFGVLRRGVSDPKDDQWRTVANRVLHPMTVAALVQGEAEYNPDPPLRTNEWPVFEAKEHDYFVVDPFSGEPDTIYTRYQIDKVANGFRDLIHRLLNDDVTFYLRRRW
jgi:antitoxin YxxD